MLVRRRVFALTTTALIVVAVATQGPGSPVLARPRVPPRVGAMLVRVQPAAELRMNGDVDSNSPAVWDLVDGAPRLHVFTSTAGVTRRSEGADLADLTRASDVIWTDAPEQGVWLEAVVADLTGTWYGYYHNERAGVVCGESGKVLPRIGAARTRDRGVTWEDLGPILEAPSDTVVCDTTNQYFHGGVGDLSVMLDPDQQYLYLFYSGYLNDLSGQGVAMARMVWADRDAPAGRLDVWNQDAWVPPSQLIAVDDTGETIASTWTYPVGTPLFPTAQSWHSADGIADAFWGPSVHWNWYLNRYVMLLNRTSDVNFTQEGIYVSFSDALDQPGQWSTPRQILQGGSWYPQVMGLGTDDTDKAAGQVARLFLSGSSSHFIEFLR